MCQSLDEDEELKEAIRLSLQQQLALDKDCSPELVSCRAVRPCLLDSVCYTALLLTNRTELAYSAAPASIGPPLCVAHVWSYMSLLFLLTMQVL
jgi:hypothetical protein